MLDITEILKLLALVLGVKSEYGKLGTRKNSIFGHFSRSVCMLIFWDVSTWDNLCLKKIMTKLTQLISGRFQERVSGIV